MIFGRKEYSVVILRKQSSRLVDYKMLSTYIKFKKNFSNRIKVYFHNGNRNHTN